jgi:hypothetical protein
MLRPMYTYCCWVLQFHAIEQYIIIYIHNNRFSSDAYITIYVKSLSENSPGLHHHCVVVRIPGLRGLLLRRQCPLLVASLTAVTYPCSTRSHPAVCERETRHR